MIKPFVGNWPLTQGFGENPQMYAKFGYKGHNGLDYGLPNGTPVIAPFSGKVIEARLDQYGYGNYVKIENPQYGTVLGHFQKFIVSVGDNVSEGQVIAYSDNTGNSTGPHLHWGVYPIPRDRNNGYGGFIDHTNLIGIPEPTTEPTEGGVDVMTEAERAEIDDIKHDLHNVEQLKGTIHDSLTGWGESFVTNKEFNEQINTFNKLYGEQIEEVKKVAHKAVTDALQEKVDEGVFIGNGASVGSDSGISRVFSTIKSLLLKIWAKVRGGDGLRKTL